MISEIKAYFKKHGINNVTSIYLFHHPEESKARVQRALQGRTKNKIIISNLHDIYEQYRFNRKEA